MKLPRSISIPIPHDVVSADRASELGDAKSEFLHIRIHPKEKELIHTVAKDVLKTTPAIFVRWLTILAAREIQAKVNQLNGVSANGE